MFGKNKWFWLAIIAFALSCITCDLESGTQSGGGKAPKPPSNVRAVAVSSTSISVTWDAVSTATSYDVYYETGSIPTITKINTVTGTSYTHFGLQPNTAYHYYITAKNNSGTSDYSSRASATTQSSM